MSGNFSHEHTRRRIRIWLKDIIKNNQSNSNLMFKINCSLFWPLVYPEPDYSLLLHPVNINWS